MNEKDKQAFEQWFRQRDVWPRVYLEEVWQAALEYARGRQEPVAVISAACAIEPTIHGEITLKPGDKLYTHPAPAVAVNEQLLEALRLIEKRANGFSGFGNHEINACFDDIEKIAEQALASAPEPAPMVRLSDTQIEQGAKKLAELFDYPREHMPDKGKGEMRGNAQSVFEAMIAKNRK